MTPERKSFEEWAHGCGFDIARVPDDNNYYVDDATQYMWQGWRGRALRDAPRDGGG